MKKLVIASALCLSSVALSGVASASQQVTYSTDEYCSLQSNFNKSQHQKLYLKAYAKKLGAKPSKSFCKELRLEKFATLPKADKSWDYSFNKPYAGSVRRLSNSVIKKLRLKKLQAKDVLASR
ncbi:MAG: hypothetical protein ACPGJI_07780 [Kangiellaceae bacterium]